MKKLILLIVVLSCGNYKSDNPIGLDTVWVTRSDGGGHTTIYYGYSSGKQPDSVLHVSGGSRFYKPAGDSYDCFIVPARLDSIIHINYYNGTGDPMTGLEGKWIYEDTSYAYEKRGFAGYKRDVKCAIKYENWRRQ